MKGTNQGAVPAKRIAIACVSVGVVALLLASALPVFAAPKKSSDKHQGQTTSSEKTRGEKTNGGSASPDATNKTVSQSGGDILTNAVESPSPANHVAITLTEDSSSGSGGSTDSVSDQLPSGFDVTAINSRKFSCTGKGTDAVTCTRKHQNKVVTFKQATIKIVAKAPTAGGYSNVATDSYGNYTSTPFEVQ